MKRFLRIVVAVLLVGLMSGSVKGETHYRPRISIGGHAGATMSRMSFSPSVEQAWKPGTTFGVNVSYIEEKLFGLTGEINFVQRGWSEDFGESDIYYSRTLNYVTLPIMTHIYFGSRRVKCFVNIGPEFGYLLGESISADFDYTNPKSDPRFPKRARMTEQLATDVKNKFDYGITAGAGVEFYVRPRHSFNFEVRFYYGLGNIFPSSKADVFSASRSMSLAATLGYNFRLK